MANTQILLRRRPDGPVTPDCFELREAAMPTPGPGQALVRHTHFSLDPYMRGRMSAARSYSAPVEIGAVMEAQALGVVEHTEAPGFSSGDIVVGGFGWQAFSVVDVARLRHVPEGVPPTLSLGVLGMPGLTAHVGMADIGQAKPGETVVVSAASGAVGAVVGQIAKAAGARVVGVAGGQDKCAFVVDALGFEACIDHRAGDLDAAFDVHCPGGIDVYWENVGGALQHAAFKRLNDFGRMPMCGMIAEYNDASPAPGPSLMTTVRRRLRIQGFIVSDQWARMGEWIAAATPMIQDGRMKYREDIVDGIAHAPDAFIGLLAGRNFGKLLVKV